MVTDVFHGWEGEIKQGNDVVAYCTSVSLEVNGNREGVFALGSRLVQEWKSGNLEIGGSIDHIWVDHTFGTSSGSDTPPEYTMTFKLTHGSSGSAKTATLSGLIFTNWSQEIPEDGLVTESIEYQAKTIAFT